MQLSGWFLRLLLVLIQQHIGHSLSLASPTGQRFYPANPEFLQQLDLACANDRAWPTTPVRGGGQTKCDSDSVVQSLQCDLARGWHVELQSQ